MAVDEHFTRAQRILVEVIFVGAILAPLGVCVANGVVHSSLWLDEVTYYYMEDDVGLRAAELGRPGSLIVPRLGIFFYCDLQRVFHACLRPLGLTIVRDPELYLRLQSLIANVIAVLALYLFVRRRGRGPADAALVAGAFGSTPLILHYAFDGRVYELTTMLLVLVGIALHGAARRPSGGRLLLVAALSAVAAHSHFWTLCLFGPLLLVTCYAAARARRTTPWVWAGAAAAVPALAVIGAEVFYLRATDPGAALFPAFRQQPLLATLMQLGISNFTGVVQTQYVVNERLTSAIPAWIGVATLVCLLASSAWPGRTRKEERDARLWPFAVALAFLSCWLLAVTYGYYTQARYHVPLLGALFVAAGLEPTRFKRLLFGLVIAVNLALLPSTIRAIELKGSVKQVAALIQSTGTRDVSVVCQHVVTGGFPLPAQAIVLDFYLNVLHPDETSIPIHELPDLSLVNGRRGVYDLFNGGSPLLEHYLASTPDLWREELTSLRPTLFVLRQLWNVEAGIRQNDEFARVVLERGDRIVTRKLFAPGFPRSVLVEVHRSGTR